MLHYEIRREFSLPSLDEAGQVKAERVARLFSDMLDELEEVVGTEGREMAIVRTKLQEAAFFANWAVSETARSKL
jgi:hypothetical protein